MGACIESGVCAIGVDYAPFLPSVPERIAGFPASPVASAPTASAMAEVSREAVDEAVLLREVEWLRKLAFHMTSSDALAEDLVQDTAVEVLARPPSNPVKARPWLAGVMRNLFRSRLQREASRRRREARVVGESPASDVAGESEKEETRRILAESVAGLPEPYREAVTLRYFQGLSCAEIARQTKTPAPTVRSQLRRGIGLLRSDAERRIGPAWMSACLALVPEAWGASAAAGGVARRGLGISRRVEVAFTVATLGAVFGVSAWILSPSGGEDPRNTTGQSDPEARVAAEGVAVEGAVARRTVVWARTVELLVQDAETGRPIPDAVLRGAAQGELSSDPSGMLRVGLEGEGALDGIVGAAGYQSTPVHVSAEGTDQQVVELRPAGVIHLRIREREVHAELDGRYQAIAWPSDLPAPTREQIQGGEVASGRADRSGTITIDGLVPGVRYSVAGAGGGYIEAAVTEGVLPSADVHDHSVLRLYGLRLRPVVSGQRIEVDLPGLHSDFRFTVQKCSRNAVRISTARAARTLALGQLGVADLWADSESLLPLYGVPLSESARAIDVAAELPGYSCRPQPAHMEWLRDGIPEMPLELTQECEGWGNLRVDFRTRPETLAQLDSGGEVLDLVLTRLDAPEQHQHEYAYPVQGLSEGIIVIRDVPAGTYRLSLASSLLRAWDGDLGTVGDAVEVTVASGEEATAEVQLFGLGGLSVAPWTPTGGYSGPVSIELRPLPDERYIPVRWEKPPYLLAALPPGNYEVRVTPSFRGGGAGEPPRTHSVSVRPGETTAQTIELPAWDTR